MNMKISNNSKLLKKSLLTIVIYIVGILMVTPLIWMISTSFKKPVDVFNYPVEWIPKDADLNNYRELFSSQYSFGVYYLNSLYVTFATLIGAIFFNSMAGYAFARIKFIGRDKIFLLYLSALIIPFQVTLVPRFLMFNSIGILDSHLALILPGVFQVICTFLLRQFFMQIPFEYSESALLDGASELTICFRIIMPLSKPALATLTILVFTWSFNDYINPLIFLSTKSLYTLPVGLNDFIDEMGTRYAPMMAASTLSIVLIIIVFLVSQKYFIESLASGGVKG